MDKPLAGLKVVELARILAGPWAGQLLADPQVVHRGLRIDGEAPGLASPIVIDGRRQVSDRPAPRLGKPSPC